MIRKTIEQRMSLRGGPVGWLCPPPRNDSAFSEGVKRGKTLMFLLAKLRET